MLCRFSYGLIASLMNSKQFNEVPPFPVTVVREEGRGKTVSQEAILPLGNIVEQVVGEGLQVPIVPVGETKLKPVEHFVEQVVGDIAHMKQILIQAHLRAKS